MADTPDLSLQFDPESLAHDLRNPLAAMQNAIDVIRLDPSSIDHVSQMTDVLQRQLFRLMKRIDELAELSTSKRVQEPVTLSSSDGDAQLTRQELVKLDILIVDDTRMAAYTLHTLLTMLGHTVRSVLSVSDAMIAIENRMPNIVFSDICMPSVDGHELAKRIRSLPNGSSIRLVAISGLSEPAAKQLALESGFDDYVVKPVDHATLVRIMEQIPR